MSKFKFSEKERKELDDLISNVLEYKGDREYFIGEIESILSEPEPPKYIPKQGEAVLFPEDGILKVGVFSNMVGDKYRIEDGSRSAVHKICIPYEANKQGYSADALLSELSKPTHQWASLNLAMMTSN